MQLVGIWLLSQWMKAGQSRKIRLVELGPGRGTLMDDILRVVHHFPSSRFALRSVHLIENSLAMQAIQKEKLRLTSKDGVWDLLWHDSLGDLPQDTQDYTMLVAHEFFDALPIHVLERTQQGWHEVLISDTIGALPTTFIEVPQSRFRLVLSPSPTPTSTILGLSSPRFQALPVGSRIEVSHTAFKVARTIAELLGSGETSRGSALIVDYGHDKTCGDSFRAFKDHKIVDVFHRPGECDLTANVDFAYLKEAFAGLATPHGPLPQSIFLTRMGMQARVEALKHSAKEEERKDSIEKAAGRLVDVLGMGNEYQVLGITSHGKSRDDTVLVEDVWPFVDIQKRSEPV